MSILKFLGLAGNPDHASHSGETDTVRKIVQELDSLPEDQARYVAAFAYLLSRVARADCLFAVAAADNNISTEEDYVVKQISEELKLYHSDYIAARLKFKEYLAVLKLGKS
jgi:Tellurite resistance protein TerB